MFQHTFLATMLSFTLNSVAMGKFWFILCIFLNMDKKYNYIKQYLLKVLAAMQWMDGWMDRCIDRHKNRCTHTLLTRRTSVFVFDSISLTSIIMTMLHFLKTKLVIKMKSKYKEVKFYYFYPFVLSHLVCILDASKCSRHFLSEYKTQKLKTFYLH